MRGKIVMIEETKMPDKLMPFTASENVHLMLRKRYLLKDAENNTPIETPEQMFWRVAWNVAIQEAVYGNNDTETHLRLAKKFYEMMVRQMFLPNSPTLMNAGKPHGQLSACFVLPVEDSVADIFEAIKSAAIIHKSGGGTGFSFSRIRPKNSIVASSGGVASGPLSFLKIFNVATEQINQGGVRRGANMGILRVDHPDIVDFIKAKEVDGVLTSFNLSVAITERFMECLQNDTHYELYDPHQKTIVGTASARYIWDLLVDRAWQSGDPGIVFIDRINKFNPTPKLGEIESTNPCGEQPLLPYEACNLGSINLAKFCDNVMQHTENPREHINWLTLSNTVEMAVHFLDNVIDANAYPLKPITEQVNKTRKIGLGVMGFADMLFKLRVPYDSEEAVGLAEHIMCFINDQAHLASSRLAQKRGPFPAYDESIYAEKKDGPYRNATITTIAPTGSLSIIAECSSGIEPVFALCFTKNILGGEKFVETNPYLVARLDRAGCNIPEIMQKVREKGSIQDIAEIPDDIRRVFVTAMDIDPMWHLRIQAAFQKYTDNAVSKTVNLPNSATREDIDAIYRRAYELGCKGVTVYRDGCKSIQVLATGEGQARMEGQKSDAQPESKRLQRPGTMQGFTKRIKTGLGMMYLTVNELDGKPFEVFVTIGKSGHSVTAKAEAIGRLVSLALRNRVELKEIITQLKGIGGEHPIFSKHGVVNSIPDAIARVLEAHYCQNNKMTSTVLDINGNTCPECGGVLVQEEGCAKCPACGYSKCS